jgi:hypothetical protein
VVQTPPPVDTLVLTTAELCDALATTVVSEPPLPPEPMITWFEHAAIANAPNAKEQTERSPLLILP